MDWSVQFFVQASEIYSGRHLAHVAPLELTSHVDIGGVGYEQHESKLKPHGKGSEEIIHLTGIRTH